METILNEPISTPRITQLIITTTDTPTPKSNGNTMIISIENVAKIAINNPTITWTTKVIANKRIRMRTGTKRKLMEQ